MIGATTVSEYRKYIEKDAALERRFQPVFVDEPSLEDTIAILRGIKEKYEVHHGIRITDDAVISAAKLSDRYIADRFLPDKAIDLIDEAASGLKIETESMPNELDIKKRKITQLEIELTGLKREHGEKVGEKRKDIDKKLNQLKAEVGDLEKKWDDQRKIIKELQDSRKKIDELKIELDKAERNVDLNKAAELKYGKLPDLEKKVLKLKENWDGIPEKDKLLREEVTDEDIAKVVARWTGVPVTKLLETESQRLTNLEKELDKRKWSHRNLLISGSYRCRENRDRESTSRVFVGKRGYCNKN